MLIDNADKAVGQDSSLTCYASMFVQKGKARMLFDNDSRPKRPV